MSGVEHCFGEPHGHPGADSLVKDGVTEFCLEAIHDGAKIDDARRADAIARTAAVDGGGDFGPLDALEHDREVGEDRGDVRDVPGAMQRVDGAVEQSQALLEVPVERLDRRGIPGGAVVSVRELELLGVQQSFTENGEGSLGIAFSERSPIALQRKGDPEGVPIVAGAVRASSAIAMASALRPIAGSR